ncbi:MAG: sugar phosphate isomerase/epimerase [Planctomycetaceae bacterium]|nr:sugar phosphate isomerase/epimerase [Planctomycetaceae bacterium]
MANITIGINMEFVRSADKSFAWGVAKAAELGYEFVEPMVHWGRELLSEAGYFHSYSMLDDPLELREICEKEGVQLSGLSAHTPLAKPEISVNYLLQAIRFAAEAGAPVVNTDEGPPHAFTGETVDHTLMQYVLTIAAKAAQRRGILIGLEPHQIYSQTPEGLDRIFELVPSPAIGINFDTGNAYLCQQDPYQWLEHVRDRLVHLHAKDISIEQGEDERGKVTGTPVGCACGEGVIDWGRVVDILASVDREICFSVECGTVEQAAASIEHLKKVIGRTSQTVS